MTYLAVALLSAAVGAWCDRWWSNYLADADHDSGVRDQRSMQRHSRASEAINLRRWN